LNLKIQRQVQFSDGCGAKFLVCKGCGGLFTRVHPALEAWEGVSAR